MTERKEGKKSDRLFVLYCIMSNQLCKREQEKETMAQRHREEKGEVRDSFQTDKEMIEKKNAQPSIHISTKKQRRCFDKYILEHNSLLILHAVHLASIYLFI